MFMGKGYFGDSVGHQMNALRIRSRTMAKVRKDMKKANANAKRYTASLVSHKKTVRSIARRYS